jgi:thiol-disulfide isomerase/thioredoxin
MIGRDQRGTDRERLRPTRRRFLSATAALGTAIVAGCVGGGADGTGGDDDTETTEGGGMASDPTGSTSDGMGTTEDESTAGGMGTTTDESMAAATTTADGGASNTSWRSIEVTPVRGGDPFSVASFDRPVVLETFAVWCPSCEKQQRKLRNLDDSVVVVSLNTDPNEDAAKVRSHAESKGFEWRFAVAPPEMTKSLIDEFGPTVTNAPSTPIVVACQNGSAEFLSGRIHSAEAILDAASTCK